MLELLHAPIVLGERLSGIAADVRGGKSVGCKGGSEAGPDGGSDMLIGGPVLLPFRIVLTGGIERAEWSW